MVRVKIALVAGILASAFRAEAEATFRSLAPGLELAIFPGPEGASRIHVVRIDPNVATLRLFTGGGRGGENKTTAEWCKQKKLAAAINAGMFQGDHQTNVGFMKHGHHVYNPAWRKDYNSVLLFGRASEGQPAARLLDRDRFDIASIAGQYATVIQNLRLIKAGGRNVWQRTEKRWSEAAVASTKDGKLLFIFSRTAHTMHEANELLLRLPLGVENAMHVEGGPEASLSIHAGDVDLDLAGSYETGFNENDNNREQWSVPNVIGVAVQDSGSPAASP